MRTRSARKIEKQAEAYASRVGFRLSTEDAARYAELQVERQKLLRQWDSIVAKAQCPGGHACICKSLPEYVPVYIDGVKKNCDEINRLYAIGYEPRRRALIEETARLHQANRAINRYNSEPKNTRLNHQKKETYVRKTVRSSHQRGSTAC